MKGTDPVPPRRLRLLPGLGETPLLAFILLVIVPCGVIHHGDGQARYAQAKAIALNGTLSIPQSYIADNPEASLIRRAANGRFYSVHGPGMPLIWTPLIWLALMAERATGLPLDPIAGFLISMVNPALVLITWRLVRTNAAMISTERSARAVGHLYLFGTMAFVYANTSFSEVVCGLAVLFGVTSAALSDRTRLAGMAGLITGALCLVRYELLLLAACAPLLLLVRRCWRQLPWTTAAALVGPTLAAILNWAQRGSPLKAGPGTLAEQFTSPWAGLLGYCLDMDKALWLYFPILWLLVPAMLHARSDVRLRPLLLATILLWVVYTPLYAASIFEGRPNWGGGLCYGTRHFVILMPVSVLIMAPFVETVTQQKRLAWRTCVVGIMAVGLILQAPGVSVKSEQAEMLAKVTGETILETQAKLLWLKAIRGPAHPEAYYRSDLVTLQPGEEDTAVDFRDRRTFYWLHHWWSIALANRLQGQPLFGSHS